MSEKPFFCRELTKEQIKNNVRSEFAQRIKKLRKRRGEKQEYISMKLGLGNCTYGTYENDRYLPDILTLKKLAVHFNVSADYLLGLIDETNHSDVEIPRISGLFEECREIMNDISFEPNCSDVFSMLIKENEFLRFLHYINTYLTYSAKFFGEQYELLKDNEVYKESINFDVSKKVTNPMAYPDGGVKVSDIYLHLIHEKLDELLKSIASKNNADFMDKMKKELSRIVCDRANDGTNDIVEDVIDENDI